MGVMIFNGRSNVDVGVEVELIPDYVIPERECDVYHVPGRSGDLIIDKGSFKNSPRTYQISALTPNGQLFSNLANDISEWLCSPSGYVRLEDSYEPDYYRYACFHETNTIASIFGKAGRATINFDCKPQRYLKSGDIPVSFLSSGTIVNPTGFVALPIINVWLDSSAQGSVTIGNSAFAIAADSSGSSIDNIQDSNSDYILDSSNNNIQAFSVWNITVNSELQDAYSGTINKNSKLILNGEEFPTLKPGSNTISFSGGVTMVEVIPKWWTV